MDLLINRWPRLASELRQALITEGLLDLADAVESLAVVERCGCGDDFCQSFYTAPPPNGAYGPGHRTLPLLASWPGMLNVDLVDHKIMQVEVLDRAPLDWIRKRIIAA